MELNPGKHYSEEDTESLIAACILGDATARLILTGIYANYAGKVIHRYIINKHGAQDVIIESFDKMTDRLETFDNNESFKSWFKRILVNTALDYLRKNQKYDKEVCIEELEIEDPEDDVISKISEDEILKLVNQLPNFCKKVFKLSALEGYPHREIALLFGITEGTSRGYFSDATKKLRIMIKKEYPDIYLNQNFNDNPFHDR